jgi:hypothetical protein
VWTVAPKSVLVHRIYAAREALHRWQCRTD